MATETLCVRCGSSGLGVPCPACDSGLDLGALFRPDAGGEPSRRGPAAAQPGNRFGEFTRVELLGDGSMGQVWKAWDRKLHRWVALKFPKCETQADVEQLKREASSAGMLSHPNVATVYGSGQANGRHYIAMQYVDGVTLAEYGREDRRKLIAFVRFAAMGVACAHSRGIIHRDLKPENILVAREREQIYVSDFGIARAAATGSRSGEVIGTPPYMSPEQARGERVDCRSDVYSLAATLYELLADRPPFLEVTPEETIRKVLTEEPQPLRHLDADLNAILLKGLDKAPAERYQTVLDFADDLQRYLEDEPLRARRSNLLSLFLKKAKRHRGVALSAALGLAATLLATSISLVARFEERRRHEAEGLLRLERELERQAQGRLLLEAEATKRNDMRELLVLWNQVVLAKQGCYQARRNPQATRREIEAAVVGLNDYVARHPEQLQGYYVRARGRLYLDNLEGARSDLEKAIALEPDFAPGWALLGRVKVEQSFRNRVSDERDYSSRLRESTSLLQEATVAFERSRKGDGKASGSWGLQRMEDEASAELLARAMAMAFLDRNLDGARRILEEAQRRSPSEEYCNLLGVWAEDAAADIAWQTEALAIRPQYPLAYFDRGVAKGRSGDPSGALEDYTRALEIDPRFLPARYHRALLQLNVFQEGRRALEDFSEVLKLNPNLVPAYVGRARARMLLGDPRGAIEELDAAAARAPADATLYLLRSGLRERTRDFVGAQADADAALQLDPRDPAAYVARGRAKENKGDLRGAQADATIALMFDPENAEAYANRAGAKRRLGDASGALEDASRALDLDPELLPERLQQIPARDRKQELAKALAECRRALELRPGDAGQRIRRASLLLQVQAELSP